MLLWTVLLFIYADASTGKCTPWKQETQTCYFNGSSMRTWSRTCFNTEFLEEVCWSENPDSVKDDCSEWVVVREKCSLRGSGFGDKWIRMCKTLHDKTEICVNEDPNLPVKNLTAD